MKIPSGIDALDTYTGRVLDPFTDPTVDEVLINGSATAWTARGAQLQKLDPIFKHREAVAAWVLALARRDGVRLDPVVGSAGGALRTGDHSFRWHAVLPPLAPDGPVVAVRRHRFAQLQTADFAKDPKGQAALLDLRAAVSGRQLPILLAGPTGSGKTSLLAALLREDAANERVVVLESVEELPPLGGATIRLLERRSNLEGVGALDLAHLVREALRLRPDRLVVGEIRGSECAAFLTAAATGHAGAMTTIHAGSIRDVALRLANLAYLAPPVLGVALLARGAPPRLASFEPISLELKTNIHHSAVALV